MAEGIKTGGRNWKPGESGGAVDKEKKNDIFKTKYLTRGDKNEQRKS